MPRDKVLRTVEHGKISWNTWVGILDNGRLKWFNLLQPSVQHIQEWSKVQELTSGKHRSAVVCVFDCWNPNLICGYDLSHRLTRSTNSANYQITSELKRLDFFRAMGKIRPDLSGLTNARLVDVRKGMGFLSGKLNSINLKKTGNGLSVGIVDSDDGVADIIVAAGAGGGPH